MFKSAFVCVALFVSLSSFGQAIGNNKDGILVIYDPMFWKDKLHLKGYQCREIDNINRYFYRSLENSAASSKKEANALIYEKLVLERSERIWNIFSSAQKKKWKKLHSETKLAGASRVRDRTS